jgi:hypothetical protein
VSVEFVEKPERYGDSDARSGSGKWEYTARVLSEANPETALLAAIAADAGFFWYNLYRKKISFQEVGGYIYTATVDWTYETPDAAMQDPTASPGGTGGPGGTAPSGTPSLPATPDESVGASVSLEIGGKPPKLVQSLEVLVSQRAGGGGAPDNMGLLNIVDGTPEGIDLPEPSCTLNIDRLVDFVTMGYINLIRASMYKTNDAEWGHMPARSVLFMGCHFQSEASGRVKAAFKFGLREGRSIPHGQLRSDVGFELPTTPLTDPVEVAGWEHLEIDYGHVFDTPSGVRATRPSGFRVHRILEEMDFADFGIGT